MRLALGTVQFGLAYGIANESGQVSSAEAAEILDRAWAAGIGTLDTAIAYGESERRLGQIGVRQWRVISKLPAVPETCGDVDAWVRESVYGSLQRLGIPRLGGLMLHRSQQLDGVHGDALYKALAAVKERGEAEKIGVSIYGPEELDALVPRYQFDLVQAPFNVFDRRLVESGWLSRLRGAGTEVHVRSVFLQGLLLMDPASRPAAFDKWQALWKQWHRWLDDQALTPLQACLGYAMSQAGIDRVVVGVDSVMQLQEILSAVGARRVTAPRSLATDDIQLLNPSNWLRQ